MTRAEMLQTAVLALGEINSIQRPTPDQLSFQEAILVAATSAWDGGYHWSSSVFAVTIRPMVREVAFRFREQTGTTIKQRYVDRITFTVQAALIASECAPPRTEERAAAPATLSQEATTSAAPQAPDQRRGGKADPNRQQLGRLIQGRKRQGLSSSAEAKADHAAKKARIQPGVALDDQPRPYRCPQPGCHWRGTRMCDIRPHLYRTHGIEGPTDQFQIHRIHRMSGPVAASKLVTERPLYRERCRSLVRVAEDIEAAHAGWLCPEAIDLLRSEVAPTVRAANDVSGMTAKKIRQELTRVRARNCLQDAVDSIRAENKRCGVGGGALDRWLAVNNFPNGDPLVVDKRTRCRAPDATLEYLYFTEGSPDGTTQAAQDDGQRHGGRRFEDQAKFVFTAKKGAESSIEEETDVESSTDDGEEDDEDEGDDGDDGDDRDEDEEEEEQDNKGANGSR